TDTSDLIRHEAQSRQKDIEIMIQPWASPVFAQVDQDQLKQVFWNLSANAFDAVSAGGRLTISVRCRQVRVSGQSGEVIEIAFQDTGVGIKKEHLDKIFLPFFTTKKEGSGLGLAAVYRIVDLHGGWVRVDSEEGKGARFVVCLPRSAEGGPRLWYEGREPWKRS
ncbi:MAG TPA: ATP-binding protein, partial [Nitrospiraceae bacterium]|nr:ATP-binding protein [Nitrospiraceae bacterium]